MARESCAAPKEKSVDELLKENAILRNGNVQYQRMFEVIIAAGLLSREKMEQAESIVAHFD